MDRPQRAALTIDPALPATPPWSSLKPKSVAWLLSGSTPIALRRGDEVLDTIGVVLSGVLAAEHHLSDGRRVLSELFHLGSLIDFRRSDRPRQGRLVALKTSTLLVIDDQWHDRHIDDHPDVIAAMAVQLRDQLSRQRDHAIDLAAKTPFEKLASVLFEMQRWPDATVDPSGGAVFKTPIRRVDIADYIGVKPETLSRAVRHLEREDLIGLPTPDHIRFNDQPAMRRIASGGRPRRSTKRT